MHILAIETSCDETAVALVEASGGLANPTYTVEANALLSQIDIHKEYGGVFPALAKREHAKNLVPLLKKVLDTKEHTPLSEEQKETLKKLLEREPAMYALFIEHISATKPNIDMIAVTQGPGLAPALWVGVNFAKALSYIWDIPVIPVNHMEGHIASVLLEKQDVTFPALALLISGGHTELVKITAWGEYERIGVTRDDAVGEAFDKVARLMNLEYPGGPKISKLANEHRTKNPDHAPVWDLPKPMLHSKDLDFSFSGLKTAVLYAVNKKGTLTDNDIQTLAREFEDTVTEVLLHKTKKALEAAGADTLIIAGGVSANNYIRETFVHELSDTNVLIPDRTLSTDNAIMIALAGYLDSESHPEKLTLKPDFIANGNLKL